jgi:hypothetical protein
MGLDFSKALIFLGYCANGEGNVSKDTQSCCRGKSRGETPNFHVFNKMRRSETVSDIWHLSCGIVMTAPARHQAPRILRKQEHLVLSSLAT